MNFKFSLQVCYQLAFSMLRGLFTPRHYMTVALVVVALFLWPLHPPRKHNEYEFSFSFFFPFSIYFND